MRWPLPPTGTPACARASPCPLLAAPVDNVVAASTARLSCGLQREPETSSRAAAVRAGAGSDTSVGRPLPPEGRRLKGARVEPGSPLQGAPPPGNARRETDWPVPVQPAALRSTGIGDLEQAPC